MDEVWVDAGYSGKQNRAAIAMITSSGVRMAEIVSARTNNEAEYLAVLEGVSWVKRGGTVYTDSRLVYMQVTGEFKINHDNFKFYAHKINQMLAANRVTLRWIPREENKRADALVREVLYGEHPDAPS